MYNVCMALCICILCICVSVYLCICVFVYLCTCVCVYVCICVSVYLCICVSVYLRVCVFAAPLVYPQMKSLWWDTPVRFDFYSCKMFAWHCVFVYLRCICVVFATLLLLCLEIQSLWRTLQSDLISTHVFTRTRSQTVIHREDCTEMQNYGD